MIIVEKAGDAKSLQSRDLGKKVLEPQAGPGTVYLATCDRVELYKGSGQVPLGVVRHLFRVAAGLESPFLGENFILGQVKNAYLEAQARGGLSPSLHRLFQAALRVGKLVRTHTELNRGAVGHTQGVIHLLETSGLDWKTSGILLLGVNKMTTTFLHWLEARKVRTLFLGNRTLEKAREMTSGSGVEVLPLSQLDQVWNRVEVVISMTSAPHLIIRQEQVPRDRTRWFFDLASPRDIDPQLRDREEVQLFDLDDVERLTARNLSARGKEVLKASALVDQEVIGFLEDQERRRQGNPRLRTLASWCV